MLTPIELYYIGADYTQEYDITLSMHLWEQAYIIDRIYSNIEQVVMRDISRDRTN